MDRRAVREAARRRRARRGAALSAGSTVVVLGLLTVLVVTSPGWSSVRQTFFSASAFKDAFPDVLKGFWLDVKLFVIVEVVVLALGLLVALCRTSRTPALFPIRLLATVFTIAATCDLETSGRSRLNAKTGSTVISSGESPV